MKYELFTEVKDGVITRNRKAMRDILKCFEGQSIKITIEKKKKQRSNSQNRYYWGCLVPYWKELILQEWGELWTKEQTHEFLKMNFGSIEGWKYTANQNVPQAPQQAVNDDDDDDLPF